MDHAGIMEAWRLWWSGKLTDDFLLYGIKLLWWARIGKGLELIGGMTIVLDVIGPDRLRRWGASMQGRVTRDFVVRTLKASLRYLLTVIRILRETVSRNKSSGAKDADESAEDRRFNTWASLINLIVSFYIADVHYRVYQDGWGMFIIVLGGALISVGPVITVVLLCIAILFGYLLQRVIKWIAIALENPHLDKWVKGIATVLLLVGFHFDFLAA